LTRTQVIYYKNQIVIFFVVYRDELQPHQIENFDLQATLAENFDDEYQGIKQVYHKKYLCNT
ncbi:MAG: hypothetical protein KAH08_09100, partial [Methylococcales bacterium]|nr:hypothetical protein [Methylococcales bacterium]